MNRGGWILLLGSALLAAVVAATATRERARSPEEDLRAISDRMRRGRIDREEALSELDHLVDRTVESGDSVIAGRVRLARARILMEIDALDRAREDFQLVLGLGILAPKEAREVEDDLIELDLRSGKFAQGLERIQGQIQRDPNDAVAWGRKGEMHRGMAERALAPAREVIANRLLADTAERANAVLDRLGAMDPADPKRPALGRDLSSLFDAGDEKHSQQVLRYADLASSENEKARVAFATSLSDLGVQAGRESALASLLDLLDRAGRCEEAAEIGTSALTAAETQGDTNAVGRLVHVLDRLDREVFASDLGKWLVDRETPIAPGQLLELCDLFFRAGRWSELQQSAARLGQIGNTVEAGKAALYSGLAQVHLGAPAVGRFALDKWLKGAEPEPFAGARAEAWRGLADAAGQLRMNDEEMDALESAIQLDHEHAGPSMLRLSSLLFSSAHGGYRRPEELWAQAMNLMPERTDELLVRWKRMGDQELKSAGLPRSGALGDAGWRRILAVPSSASPYQLYVLASALLDADQPTSAEPLTRLLVRSLPTFVPGLDLAIRAQLGLDRHSAVLSLLLARMSAAGADSKCRAILSRTPLDRLTPETKLQLMAADPEGFGRRELARTFVADGEPELALLLVGDAQGANGLLEARLVAARACLETDQADRAFEILLPLGRHVSSSAEAFELFSRAAAGSGHHDDLLRATTRAAAGLLPRKKEWLSLCDTLLSLSDARSAMPLVRRLDADKRTRGGEVLLHRAWAELLLGEDAALRQTLERASAFDTHGSVELVGVLACARADAWSGLPEALEALKKTMGRPPRLQAAAIAALEGKRAEARAAIESAFAGDSIDPLWVFADHLLSAEEGVRPHPAPASFGDEVEQDTARYLGADRASDPRVLWCALLAIDAAPAAGWIEAHLAAPREKDADTGGERATPSFWPSWFSARLARARGERATERRLLGEIAAAWPGFAPAWDRLEELARALHTSREGMDDLRERRLHGLGSRAGTRAQIDLEIARAQRRNRDLDAALESARRALEEDPSSSEARAELGRIHAERGEWKEAVESTVRASHVDARASDAATSGDLIRALAGAGRAQPPELSVEARRAELEALERREPDDPRVPAALAWMDLESDPRNPTLAVARAYGRLDRFVEAHKDVALETLCEGADAAWTDLLLALDPARARDFLKSERKRIPTALEPWLQLGRVAAAERRATSGEDELDLIRRMAPVPRVLEEHARARLAQAPTLTEIGTLTKDIRRAEGKKELGGEWSLLVGRALYDLGPRGTASALAIATRLSAARDLTAELAAAATLLRAEALLALGGPAQVAEARTILAGLEKNASDPYRATVLLACTRLAAGLGESRAP